MDIVQSFFPAGWMHYALGGVLIGVAVSMIYVFTGQQAGMSSVFSSTWSWFSSLSYFQQPRFLHSRIWRLVLALGLIMGAALYGAFSDAIPWQTDVPLWQLALGSFIAGFGARMSNGCTSGHGICGMASLQLPSLLAVLVFLATAFVTANVMLLLGGH